MEKISTWAERSTSNLISHLNNFSYYKCFPLQLHKEIRQSNLKDCEKLFLYDLFFKSDIYTHEIPYDKTTLAKEASASVRTIERRVQKLTAQNWIVEEHSFNNQPTLRFNIPKVLKEKLVSEASRRASPPNKEQNNRKYVTSKLTNERLFATYENKDGSKTILYMNTAEHHIPFKKLVSSLEGILSDKEQGINSTVNPFAQPTNHTNSKEDEEDGQSFVAAVEEENSQTSAAEQEILEKIELKEQLLSTLSICKYGEKEQFFKVNDEIIQLKKALKTVQSTDEHTEPCGQLALKPAPKPELATNLSQTTDNLVATPYYINKQGNKNDPKQVAQLVNKRVLPDFDNLNGYRSSAELKTRNIPRRYQYHKPVNVPKCFKNKIIRFVEEQKKSLGLSDPQGLQDELLFAISRTFVGRPKDKESPTIMDTLRYNTAVAMKLVREGRWQTPTGCKQAYTTNINIDPLGMLQVVVGF